MKETTKKIVSVGIEAKAKEKQTSNTILMTPHRSSSSDVSYRYYEYSLKVGK